MTDQTSTSTTGAPAVAGQVQHAVRRVSEAWRQWRHRRYWTAERQLEHLLLMVQADNRWLAHDKTADALTTRYLAALAPDWMSRYHDDPDAFRRALGLCPHEARRKRIERGEPLYGDGQLPERGWD